MTLHASAPPLENTEKAVQCPALFITAPASGQGKTTVTAALARYYRNQGLRVRVFKAGPDFLDPMVLEYASGAPVYSLDLWMGGETHCRQLLFEAAQQAALILIEGVMGLYDGTPSSADLAQFFDIPVMAVIDSSAMAQTFGAVAFGLTHYRPDLSFAGIFANRVAGEAHYQMLHQSLPPELPALGWLASDAEIALPERRTGLVPADELNGLEAHLAYTCARLQAIPPTLPTPITFKPPPDIASLPRLLQDTKIGIASDRAFKLRHQANLDLLRMLGAELVFFSPLEDSALPEVDALYLPGGYPEFYMAQLTENNAIKSAIQAHHDASKPLVAECGGFFYLLQSLTDSTGKTAQMAGLLAGNATLQSRRYSLGFHLATLPEGELKGHSFHYARITASLSANIYSRCPHSQKQGEVIYRQGRLTASCIHWYFPSNPITAAKLFMP